MKTQLNGTFGSGAKSEKPTKGRQAKFMYGDIVRYHDYSRSYASRLQRL
jgi:hypothetical protein